MKENKIISFFDKLQKNAYLYSIRMGFIKITPVIIIGSFAVFFTEILSIFQPYLSETIYFAIQDILSLMDNATLGILSIYMCIFFSISFVEGNLNYRVFKYGAAIASLMSFIILSGGLGENMSIAEFGVKGTFTAILTSMVSSAIFTWTSNKLKDKSFFTKGFDSVTSNVLTCMIPILIITLFFAAIHLFCHIAFDIKNINEIFSKGLAIIFDYVVNPFWNGFLFVLLSGLLWVFGLHGTNILYEIQTNRLGPALMQNVDNFAMGKAPTEIFTGAFFNVFVFMGGCGSLLCLLLVILFFSKKKKNNALTKTAFIPTLFNINEMAIYGLPVVLNPYLVIPFIITPVVLTLISAAAIYTGLVPYTVHDVNWTMPILFSGYLTTGSIAGSILQIVNLIIGMTIYYPFYILYENAQQREAKYQYADLIEYFKNYENSNSVSKILHQTDIYGDIARTLAMNLKKDLKEKNIDVFYQPQYNQENNCVGVEALLRWNHPLYGYIYPPIIIQIAEESEILTDLEFYIFEKVARDYKEYNRDFNKEMKFSVNVTVETLLSSSFELFLGNLKEEFSIHPSSFCIELTEQTELKFDEFTIKRLNRIHNMGYLLAIDDFSMGNTSLKYLESNQFDIVKLDGNLVKNLEKDSSNNREIINSIYFLSRSIGFSIIAEYVENRKQRDMLMEIGCNNFQGYLYSQAIPFSVFCKNERLKEHLPK